MPLKSTLGREADRQLALFTAKLPSHVLELLFHTGAGEVASERRVRNVIVLGDLPQRLAGRSTPQQLLVGDEPAQPTETFHAQILALP